MTGTLKRRALLLALLLMAAWCTAPAARSFAAGGCMPTGAPPPADAAQRKVRDLDWDGRPDTLWVGQSRNGPPSQGHIDRVALVHLDLGPGILTDGRRSWMVGNNGSARTSNHSLAASGTSNWTSN